LFAQVYTCLRLLPGIHCRPDHRQPSSGDCRQRLYRERPAHRYRDRLGFGGSHRAQRILGLDEQTRDRRCARGDQVGPTEPTGPQRDGRKSNRSARKTLFSAVNRGRLAC